MSTFELFVVFGPLIALSIGYAIMFGIMSYNEWKKNNS